MGIERIPMEVRLNIAMDNLIYICYDTFMLDSKYLGGGAIDDPADRMALAKVISELKASTIYTGIRNGDLYLRSNPMGDIKVLIGVRCDKPFFTQDILEHMFARAMHNIVDNNVYFLSDGMITTAELNAWKARKER